MKNVRGGTLSAWIASLATTITLATAWSGPQVRAQVPAPGGDPESRVLRAFRVPASAETVHLRVPVGAVAPEDRVGAALVLTEVSTGERGYVPVVAAIGGDGLVEPGRFDVLVTLPPGSKAGAERRFVLGVKRSQFVPGLPHAGAQGVQGLDPTGWAGGRVPSRVSWARTNAALRSEPLGAGPLAGLEFQYPDEGTVNLSVRGGVRVFDYRYGTVWKAGVPRDRARSSYLHPLYGLDGEVLTDDFPEDHHHHRGVFWSWPHVGVGGKEYDLWMLKGIGHRFERFLASIETSGGVVFGVENGWYAGEKRVMQERIWITTFPEAGDGRAIDLDCTWVPEGQPVTLAGAEGKSYGGMTLRYAPGTNTVITTPRGNGTNDLYMTSLPWADLSRRWAEGGKVSGAALMVAPDHPDYPPTWLTRHYGVLCLGWPGVKAQTFPPGVPIRCRYRIWVHRGVPTQARLEAVYRAYAGGWKPVE